MSDRKKASDIPKVRRILPNEYEPLCSEYLRNVRRQEFWSINWIDWDGDTLTASALLDSGVPSSTDNNRIHVSIFAAREMEAQLAIIGIHLKLGLKRKTSEVWFLEGHQVCKTMITDPRDVHFQISISVRPTSSRKTLISVASQITDRFGGHFAINTVRLMPVDFQ